jgi:predicted AAA+ superfamily ATPase
VVSARIAHFELDGFDLSEIGADRADRLWLRGGFPRAFLARTERESLRWRQELIATFLSRDIPAARRTFEMAKRAR